MYSLSKIQGTKDEQYKQIVKQLPYFLEGETNWLANMANTASHLYHLLEDVNWAGYYLLKGEELVLGPFIGKPACVRIPMGQGVCGTAALHQKTEVVKDVHQFPGHIACDAASRSEIVIPILIEQSLVGVLDIDSPKVSRFDEIDQVHLEKYIDILIEKTDWSSLRNQER